MVEYCSIVEAVVEVFSFALDSQSSVRIAWVRDMSSTNLEDDVLKRLIAVEGAVEVPLSVFDLLNSAVPVQFDVVVGFELAIYFRVDGVNIEPEFNLIRSVIGSIFGWDGFFNVDSGSVALGSNLADEEFLMYEIIVEDWPVISWEVSPGLDFDRLGLGHWFI